MRLDLEVEKDEMEGIETASNSGQGEEVAVALEGVVAAAAPF